MNKTNTYSTILGGCWLEKVVSDFGLGHSKSHFWAPENGHFPQKWPFSGMSPRVAKGRQGFPRSKEDPRDGWDELKPDRSYLSHFPPWYSKSGQFPIKNEKWPLGLSYGSIILKIVLWPYFTITHAVLTESRDWKLLPSPPLHQGGGLIIICSA